MVAQMTSQKSTTYAALILLTMAVGCGEYGGGTPGTQGPINTLNTVPSGLSRTEQVAAFTATVYPVAVASCAGGCHDTGARGAPFLFANPDPERAYTVITESQKVSLSSPAQSRVVRRPGAEFHECGSNCVMIGAQMLAAVEAWAAIVESSTGGPQGQVAVEGIVSAEVAYADGEEVEGGERYVGNQIAFWDFKDGTGEFAMDKSGVAPAMDLELMGDAVWMSNYGVDLAEGRVRASRDGSQKFYDEVARPGYGTNQYSIEMWINNENTTQEDARIVTYDRNGGNRNFSLMQQGYQYDFRNRSIGDGVTLDGREALITYDVDQDAQETLQHVVITYDELNGRRIYVDSVFTDDMDEVDGARLWNWDENYQLTFGARFGGGNDWRGRLRLAALYKQALTPDQVQMNYLAGVGKRLRLSFSVNAWTGDDTAVDFNVTELDDYSYLFCQPTFTGSNLNGKRVSNIAIAVNPSQTSAPPAQGQGFTNVNEILSGTEQQVSRGCSIIAQGNGPDQDEFALVFEELGQFQDSFTESVFGYQVDETVLPPLPRTGVRSFDRINASMSAVTGVSASTPAIADVFVEVAQQLPSTTDTRSFASSHQVVVTKLSFEYCHEMVESPTLRQAAFGPEFESGTPSFFESDVATAFGNPTLTNLLTERLTDHMLGVEQLTNQPNRMDIVAELDQLLTDLVLDCPTCDATQTMSIAKGLCTALLASAPIMVH